MTKNSNQGTCLEKKRCPILWNALQSVPNLVGSLSLSLPKFKKGVHKASSRLLKIHFLCSRRCKSLHLMRILYSLFFFTYTISRSFLVGTLKASFTLKMTPFVFSAQSTRNDPDPLAAKRQGRERRNGGAAGRRSSAERMRNGL